MEEISYSWMLTVVCCHNVNFFLPNTLVNSLILPLERRNYLFLDHNGCVLRQLSRANTLTRRPGAGNMMVHAWFSSTAALAKTMWTMAISQHQFYLDKKQVEVRVLPNQSKSQGQGRAPAFPRTGTFLSNSPLTPTC